MWTLSQSSLENGDGHPAAPSPTVPQPVYEAMRSLLLISLTSEAVAILIRLARELGGEVIADDTAAEGKTIVDARLSRSHGLRACAREGTPELLNLQAYLPQLAEDAKRILKLATDKEQLARQAGIDTLTGLPDHHSMSRLFTRLAESDIVIAVELVDYSVLAASRDVEYRDELMRSFARVLHQSVRETDHLGRTPMGDGFFIIVRNTEPSAAYRLLTRVRDVWENVQPGQAGFVAGIATTSPNGWRPTVRAADRALWSIKQSRLANCWALASEDDYEESAGTSGAGSGQGDANTVPSGGAANPRH